MTQVCSLKRIVARSLAGQFQCLVNGFCHHKLFLPIIIGRNAVSPPELARDAPVLDVLQPVLVGRHILGGMEHDFPIQHGFEGDVGKMAHLEEPLQREARFDDRIGIALRVAHLIIIVLYPFHQSGRFQVGGNLFAAFEAVHTHIEGRLGGDGSVGIEDVDGLELVGLSEGIVVGIMGGSHL